MNSEHQKKVIDRLSRKIQRLKHEIKVVESGGRLSALVIDCLFMDLDLRDKRINKAIHHIENNLSWAKGSEELLEILKGSDNNV